METGLIIGAAIVLAAFVARGQGNPAPEQPMPASAVTAGSSGPAVQTLVEQPASTAGQAGSGSMNPTGALPPTAARPIQYMPRPPVRVPINMAPVNRARFGSGAYSYTPETLGFNKTNVASTGPGTAARPTFNAGQKKIFSMFSGGKITFSQ